MNLIIHTHNKSYHEFYHQSSIINHQSSIIIIIYTLVTINFVISIVIDQKYFIFHLIINHKKSLCNKSYYFVFVRSFILSSFCVSIAHTHWRYVWLTLVKSCMGQNAQVQSFNKYYHATSLLMQHEINFDHSSHNKCYHQHTINLIINIQYNKSWS
jgi:hypothetical protein